FEPIKRKRVADDESNEGVGEHSAPEDIGMEELYTELQNIEENGDVEGDNLEGFVEVLNEMTDKEREQWGRNVAPVKATLYKTCKIAFKIINSTTLLLPKWNEHLSGLGLDVKKLRRDVSTRWNSTHDMLESFLEMREAV
ncbi:hypothetical protein C8R42DRAFT_538150, partial [Lentinula raphanica]